MERYAGTSNALINGRSQDAYCTIPTLWHSGKGKTMETKTSGCQGLRGLQVAGRMGWTEHGGLLGPWNHSVWYHIGEYTSLDICPNPQNVQREERPLVSEVGLGDGDVSVQVTDVRLAETLMVGEALHVWEVGFTGNLCTSLWIFLWLKNLSKTSNLLIKKKSVYEWE